MWSWRGRLWRSDPGEPPARVFTEEEEMEEVIYQIASGSRNGITVHLVGRKPIPLDLRYLRQSVRTGGTVTQCLTNSNRISVSWVASTTRSLSATRTELVGRILASLLNKENISCSRTSRCASRRVACKGSLSSISFAMVLHAVLSVPEASMVLTLTQRIVLCLRGNTIGSFEPCVASWPVALRRKTGEAYRIWMSVGM